MNCPTCQNEFTPITKNYYTTKYCSRKCANHRVYSDERRIKASESNRKRFANESIDDRAKRIALSVQTKLQRRNHKIENGEFAGLSIALKREQILFEQHGKCLHCGNLGIWNNKQLVLELDHINGDRTNNVRTNLRLLCPNCHSQTETFVGRNKKKVSDEDIISALKQHTNINAVCVSLGLSGSSRDYKRVRKLIDCPSSIDGDAMAS